MSITTEVRGYADAAIAQGKSVLTGAQGRVGVVAEGARKEAVKDAYAILGAGDAALSSLSKRGGEVSNDEADRLAALQAELTKIGQAIEEFASNLPESAVELVGKLQQALGKAQEALADLRTRGEALVEQARTGDLRDAKTKLDGYITSARIVRDAFAVRGEKTLVELRHDPRLASLFRAAEEKAAQAPADAVQPTAEVVQPTADAVQAMAEAVQPTAEAVTPAPAADDTLPAEAAEAAEAAESAPPKTTPNTPAATAPRKTTARKIADS